jgi:hypothetical protein
MKLRAVAVSLMLQRVVVVLKQPQHDISRCSCFSNARTRCGSFFPPNERFRSLSVTDTLRALKFEALKHPPYSSDLALSDFHLFGPMKEHLRGQKFADDNEVMLVKGHAKKLFSRGHPQACGRGGPSVLQSRGDYVEK